MAGIVSVSVARGEDTPWLGERQGAASRGFGFGRGPRRVSRLELVALLQARASFPGPSQHRFLNARIEPLWSPECISPTLLRSYLLVSHRSAHVGTRQPKSGKTRRRTHQAGAT